MLRAALFLLFCLIPPVYAQNPAISAEMEVAPGTLQAWLHGDDPRLVAWAADFAHRRNDAALLAEIPKVLERWSIQSSAGRSDVESARCRAVLLDVLIQTNAPVSMPVVRAVADDFPAQALLLIERLPLHDARSTLAEWAFGNDGAIKGTRARAAAMVLAKQPDAEFVSRILDGIEQRVVIHVVAPHTGVGSGGGGSACSDGGAGVPAQGWPPIYEYGLLESVGPSTGQADGIPVVRLGSNAITALRYREYQVLGRCFVFFSEAELRFEFVAYWLGVEPERMSWQLDESLNVEWTTKAAYERAVGKFLESQRALMTRTLQQLEAKGLVDRKIAIDFPRIAVSYECDVTPCPLQFAPHGSDVTER